MTSHNFIEYFLMARSNKKAQSKKRSEERSKKVVASDRAKNSDTVSRSEKVSKVKESTPAKVVKKITPVSEAETKAKKPGTISIKPRMLKFVTWVLVVIATLIVIDFVVQYINNDYSIAIVNGSRIPRSEYLVRLEDAYGNVIATQMMNEELIKQEAVKEDVTVSDEDVDTAVAQTKEEVGGEEELNAALEANGLTLETYRRNLKIQLLAEAMVVPEPTEEDLLAFFEEFKDTYFGEDAVYEDVKDTVAEAYTKQKFNELSGAWLNGLREEATLQNNTTDRPSYGILQITRDLLSDMNNRLDTK